MKRGHVCPVSRKRRSRRRRDGEDEEEDAVPGQIVLAPSAAGMPVVAAHPYYHPYRHFDPKMYRPGQPPMVAQTTVIAKGQLPGPAQPAPQKEGEGEASGANPAPDANMGNDGWQRAQGTWIPHGADPQGVPNAFMEHGMPPYGAAGYPGPEWDGRHHAVPMHQLSREQLAALPVEQQQQLQAAKWPASAPAAQAQPAPAAASNLGAQ